MLLTRLLAYVVCLASTILLSGCAERIDIANEERKVLRYSDTTETTVSLENGDTPQPKTEQVGATTTTESFRGVSSNSAIKRTTTVTSVASVLELRNVGELTTALLRTSESYLLLSDKVATNETRAGLSILGLTSLGAGIVIDGGSSAALEAVGLTAFTIQQSRNFLNPSETAKALSVASEVSFCIASASLRYANASDSNDQGAFHMLASAYTRNRIALRNKLTRGEFPDFSSLLAAAQAAQETARASAGATPAGNLAKSQPTPAANLVELERALSECALIG